MKTATRILTAPLHAIGWLGGRLLDVLSSINPLLFLFCLLSDE